MRRLIVAAALALAPAIAIAEDAEPWGSRDFTFHRVAVPPAGVKATIVQIDPAEEPYTLTPPLERGAKPVRRIVDAPPVGAGLAEWFWSGVSPALSASNPARLDQALGQLQLASTPVIPDTARVARLVSSYGQTATEKAKGTIVSPALALAVVSVESAGRTDALSHAGAQGLMQLMPATAARFGVEDSLDAGQNIGGGIAYLDFLLRAFGQDPILSIAAYNAGEGAVAENKGVPPYSETRNYVPKVLGAWTVTRLFCRVPPHALTDPCEFNQTEVAPAQDVADNG